MNHLFPFPPSSSLPFSLSSFPRPLTLKYFALSPPGNCPSIQSAETDPPLTFSSLRLACGLAVEVRAILLICLVPTAVSFTGTRHLSPPSPPTRVRSISHALCEVGAAESVSFHSYSILSYHRPFTLWILLCLCACAGVPHLSRYSIFIRGESIFSSITHRAGGNPPPGPVHI
jgi:hypothetical protein